MRINSKWITDLNIKLKLLEKKQKKIFDNLLGNIYISYI